MMNIRKFVFRFRDKDYNTVVIKSDSDLPIHFIVNFEDPDLTKEFETLLFTQKKPKANIVAARSTKRDHPILSAILLPMIIDINNKGLFELEQ